MKPTGKTLFWLLMVVGISLSIGPIRADNYFSALGRGPEAESQKAIALEMDAALDLKAGDYTTAITKLKSAIALDENLGRAKKNLAIAYQNQAVAQERKGNFVEAEHSYLLSEKIFYESFSLDSPELVPIYEGLAGIEEKTGKFEEATTLRGKSKMIKDHAEASSKKLKMSDAPAGAK